MKETHPIIIPQFILLCGCILVSSGIIADVTALTIVGACMIVTGCYISFNLLSRGEYC